MSLGSGPPTPVPINILVELFDEPAKYPIFVSKSLLFVLAKGINSGYIPLGAAIFSQDIYKVISQPQIEDGLFSMGFTYTGHAVACAAALKNLEILDAENILQNVRDLGPYLQSHAKQLEDLSIVGDVRGQGFMLGIDLVSDKISKEPLMLAHRVYQICLAKGVIVRPVGNIVVISPPLIMTRDQIKELVRVLRESISQAAVELT